MEILTQIGPVIILIVGLFLWVRSIYERSDTKREQLTEQVEGLTMENVTLKAENADLKRMNAEWRDLANKYHALAVKYYNLSRDMVTGKPSADVQAVVVNTTTVSIPTPDDVMNDNALPEELLG